MSFWKGLSRAMESNEQQRNVEQQRKDRLASEAKAEAFRNKQWANQLSQQAIANSRNELADARAVEQHGVTMAAAQFNIGQKVNSLAGGTGGVKSGGNRTGGKTPTVEDMNAGARALRARIDKVGGLGEMNAAQQAYYGPILGNSAASYELNKMLEAAVGKDQDLTVLTAVDRVQMVAVAQAQGEEEFAKFTKTAAEDGWDAAEVAKAMELAKSANPAVAELVLLTPSKTNLNEQEQYSSLEQQLMIHVGIWLQSNERTKAVEDAISQFSTGNGELKGRGMAALIEMGVGQDWIYSNTKEGSLLRSLSGPLVSEVPKVGEDGNLVTGGGGAVPPGTPTYTAAELLELPPAEARKLVGTRIVVDGKPGTYGIPGTSTFGGQTGASDDPKATGQRGASDEAKAAGQRKATELDDMFKDSNIEEGFSPALNAEGVSASEGPFLPEILRTDTREPDDRPEGTADEIIGRGSSSIEALIGSLGETEYGDTPRDKALQVREGVLSELAGMGITMPTNPTELGYFKEDLKALLVEDNVDISGDLLSDIVDIAKESANKGTVTVPAEVNEAVEAIKTTGTEADIKQAMEEIMAEYGEEMTGILFDGAKSARGTGKSAMMDGLQTPYDTSEPKEEGYTPPTMGATELNTPAVREAIANVPTEVKEAIESVAAQGDEAEVEQAKQEIADEFGEEVAESLFWDALKRRPGNRTQDIPGFGN
jgi:hypothetical protein